MTRLVAVLGYSPWRGSGLHPICAARVRGAQELAGPGDIVLFSGWSRREGHGSEAELMAACWDGAEVDVETDTGARHTVANVAHVAAVAARVHADDVVVVTSRWHRPRAALLVRSAFAGTKVRARTVGARTPWTPAVLLREVAVAAALPLQLRQLRRARRVSA